MTDVTGRVSSAVVLFVAAVAVSGSAGAHVVGGAADGLVSGFLHPLMGLDHILAMVTVGLWGAQLERPAIWLLPLVFPVLMAFGGFLGLVGMPLPAVEVGISASAIVLGMAVALKARPALWVCIVLVAGFAVFHGHAHGAELEHGTDPMSYSLGFVVATGLLHALGILIGGLNYWTVGERVVRAMGGVIVVAGLVFLFFALTA